MSSEDRNGGEDGRAKSALGEGSKVSFRDKLIGGRTTTRRVELGRDLVKENMARVELDENSRPRVFFAESVIQEASESWKEALVVKLLGKQMGYATLVSKLKPLWRLKGGFDVMSAGNDFYMVKFDLLEDRVKVMEGGPWMVNGHYLGGKRGEKGRVEKLRKRV